jgi:hypothetical protein
MKIYASESFSWCGTTISSHPTHIVTSGLLTHFSVVTRGLLPVIIGAKLFMTIQERHAVSEGGLAPRNGQVGYTGLFTISHGTNPL